MLVQYTSKIKCAHIETDGHVLSCKARVTANHILLCIALFLTGTALPSLCSVLPQVLSTHAPVPGRTVALQTRRAAGARQPALGRRTCSGRRKQNATASDGVIRLGGGPGEGSGGPRCGTHCQEVLIPVLFFGRAESPHCRGSCIPVH